MKDIKERFLTLKEISQKRKISITAGLTEKNNACKEKPFNTAIVYDSGKLIGEYRYIFLNMAMNIFIIQQAIKFLHTKIMEQGAEVIIVPANFPDERREHWITLLKARAIENLCFVVGVNANEIHNKYIEGKFGNTACYDPWGNLVKGRVKDFKHGKIFEFEINTEEVRKIRNKYKFLDDIVIL